VEFTYQSVHNQFTARFKKEPFIVRSPGRINLIGEHTDYNDGFVMPAAIDKEIIFAIAESDSGTSQIVALNFDETVTIDLSNPQPASSPAWANYVLGVLRQIVDRGYALKPFVCVFGGNIPGHSPIRLNTCFSACINSTIRPMARFLWATFIADRKAPNRRPNGFTGASTHKPRAGAGKAACST
jgi:hypothetical protein